MSKSVRAILLLVVLFLFITNASADIPDVSALSLEELLQLEEMIHKTIAEQATYTLLPGIYNCQEDFKWNWYLCSVKPGENGEERSVTITFHTHAPSNPAFLTYELSSSDEGMKLSVINSSTSYPLFMVVQGAPLEAVPYSGF